MANGQGWQSLAGVAQTLADCAASGNSNGAQTSAENICSRRTDEDRARDKADYRAKLIAHRDSARELARFHRMMADKYDAQIRHQVELLSALDEGMLL